MGIFFKLYALLEEDRQLLDVKLALQLSTDAELITASYEEYATADEFWQRTTHELEKKEEEGLKKSNSCSDLRHSGKPKESVHPYDKKPVELKILDLIHIHDWKALGLQLDVKLTDLDEIEAYNKSGKECTRQMYSLWLRNTREASYRDLKKAFEKLKYAEPLKQLNAAAGLGRGTLMAKVDIEAAYRLVPVHPHDRPLLVMEWKGQVFADPMLPFGLRSAPNIFNAISDALEWHLKSRGIAHIFHYLDDFAILGPPNSNECTRSLTMMRQANDLADDLSRNNLSSFLCKVPALKGNQLADDGLAPQTITSPQSMLLSLGLPPPREESTLPVLKRVLDGIRRIHTALGARISEPDGLAFWAIATSAFFSFFRLGELLIGSEAEYSSASHLSWGDVALDSRADARYLGKNPLKEVKVRSIWSGSRCSLGPHRGDSPGCFFIDGEKKPITKPRFIAQFRGYMKAAGLPSNQFAGHSFCIGAATTAAKAVWGWSRHARWIGAYLVFGQGWHAHGWAVPSATPPNGRGMADTHQSPGFTKLEQ
eukprot:Em0003g193a